MSRNKYTSTVSYILFYLVTIATLFWESHGKVLNVYSKRAFEYPNNMSNKNSREQVQIYPPTYDIAMNENVVYMNDKQYARIQIICDQPFNVVVFQNQSEYTTVTGMGIGYRLADNQTKELLSSIQQKDKGSNNNLSQTNKQNTTVQQLKQQSGFYKSSISLYSVCKNLMTNWDRVNLNLQINYYSNNQNHQNYQSHYSDQPNNTIQVKSIIFCINDEFGISRTNYFTSKLYLLLFCLVFLLLFGIKPIKQVPVFLKLIHIGTFLYLSVYLPHQPNKWLITLVLSYLFGAFGIVMYLKMFVKNPITRHQYWFTLAISSVILLSSIPLILRGHLNQANVKINGFLIYLCNFIILLNISIMISSLVNLSRFRHAFYYLVILAAIEYMHPAHEIQRLLSSSQLSLDGADNRLLAFSILLPPLIPAPPQTINILYWLFLIPFCDFFYQNYTQNGPLKFIILLIPLFVAPTKISVTLVAAIITSLWWISVAAKGDLVKMIKYKK